MLIGKNEKEDKIVLGNRDIISNNKQIFIEREVEVIFGKEWTVIKLDEHKYYKRLSGLGLSGVDFMAVHATFGLALIEMKNYTKGISSISEELDLIMSSKKRDTIQLIKIVNKYYQKQLYFRILRLIGWEYLYPDSWIIWLKAKEHLDNKNFFFLGVVDY